MFQVPVRVLLLCLSVSLAGAQPFASLNCAATAVPAILHSEGLSERVGDIVLTCAGPGGGLVKGELTLFASNGNITNALSASGTLDMILTANLGAGEVSAGASAVLTAPNQAVFSGIEFTLPASGAATLRITNVRVVPPPDQEQMARIFLATNGPSSIRVDNNALNVGISQRGLLASYSSTFLCTQSPLPATLGFLNLLATGTRFASVRVTEGFGASFQKRIPGTSQGTRILFRYSGFPSGARLFVPDAIAGSSATVQTAAGDLGVPPSGGEYSATPGGQLLLALVRGADSSGAGGTPVLSPPASGSTTFDAVSEVGLNAGEGVATYEVVDAAAGARESAQIPVFLGLAQRPENTPVQGSVDLSLGPVSTLAVASASAPIPRFLFTSPPPDCQALGDCNSGIFPKLTVASEPLVYSTIIGAAPQARYIRVLNEGGTLLNWTASITYKNGTGWLRLDTDSGFNNATIRLDAVAPAGFAPGVYDATLTINGGPLAGTVSLPVRMTASAFGPPDPAPAVISRLTNGATFAAGSLAPGSIVTLFGNGFAGSKVSVAVNNTDSKVLFSSATQINLVLPATLPTSGVATAIVTVDGKAGIPANFNLVPSSPGLFESGILNQDNSPNSASNPAMTGTAIQMFLTGLSLDNVSVKLHDRILTKVDYSGPAPGLIGLQQVNVTVPEDLPAMTTEVLVCGAGVCSPPRKITLRK